MWGSGSYGRLGLGHSRDAQTPQRVGGVLNGYEIAAGACGWYHSTVVTSTGEAAAFGTQVTDCLGNAASGSEGESGDDDEERSSQASSGSEGLRHRGRLPRTDSLGGPRRPARLRAPAAPAREGAAQNYVPQILRSFPSRVTVIQVAVGGDMLGAHTLAVTRKGQLYSWGYGPACGLGTTGNVSVPTLVNKFLGFGKGDPGSGRSPAATMEPMYGRHSHQRYRQKTSSKLLGLQILKPRIVKAVCGGSFSAVLSSEGEVFTFGLSASGRLGFRTKFRAQLRPRRIETMSEGAVDVAAGAGFVVVCSAAGRLVSWGDNIKGQLGVGHLQESHEPLVLARACPAAFVFQAVAAGDSHALALDSAGHTYSWGGEGGPMTGHGEPMPIRSHVDAAFQLQIRHLPYWWVRPRPIKALNGTRIVHISAGCLHSVAMSHHGCLYAWGATLQTGLAARAHGEGAQVSWVPRLLSPSPRLPLVRVGHVAAGGWHSMACAAICCPMEDMLPDAEGVVDRRYQALCDGFLRSHVDSIADHEARVYICCAAVRARLALPDGSDSPAWRGFAAQILRLEPPEPAQPPASQSTTASAVQLLHGAPRRSPQQTRVARVEEEAREEEDEEEESLMGIVALHRSRQRNPGSSRSSQQASSAKSSKVSASAPGDSEGKGPSPSLISDGDEAAGKAVASMPSAEAAGKAVASRPAKKKAPTPVFSSDSSESEGNTPARRPAGPPSARGAAGRAAAAPQPVAKPAAASTLRSRRGRPKPVPVFSSDSSSGSEGDPSTVPARASVSRSQQAPIAAPKAVGRPAASRFQRGHRQPPSARETAAPVNSKLDVELCMFSEPVLWALVRFLYTDSLGDLQVIDESHPEYAREQQLRKLPVGPAPGDVGPLERPTLQRASKGLLLRREVSDLRCIGSALKSERLTCLCNQLLHRIDAPGLPSLFVPASTLRSSMWTLRVQASEEPSHDGPDVRVLCGRRIPRAERWGHRRDVRGNQLWTHAFVLLSGCRGITLEDFAESHVGGLALRRVRRDLVGLPGIRFELDMREFEEDLIVAWLRYLYTHEDLTLLWPCHGATKEQACFAEGFWTELIRLAQLVGDEKLQLYAQDTLVSALSSENWAPLARFAEETQCGVLSEAALTTGIRLLHPALLRSFNVPSSLEGLAREGTGSDSTGQSATVGTAAPGRPGASRGPVDLELEQRLFSLRPHGGFEPTMLVDMKRSSPVIFAELTGRLADGVKNTQKAVAQLQHAAEFFDRRQRLMAGGDASGRSTALEVLGLLAILAIFAVPSALRSKIFDYVAPVLGPVWEAAKPAAWGVELEWLPALGNSSFQAAVLNVFMVVLVVVMMWTGLKN